MRGPAPLLVNRQGRTRAWPHPPPGKQTGKDRCVNARRERDRAGLRQCREGAHHGEMLEQQEGISVDTQIHPKSSPPPEHGAMAAVWKRP
eukprot:362837-Chlamydomonas_euryale.AAC.3